MMVGFIGKVCHFCHESQDISKTPEYKGPMQLHSLLLWILGKWPFYDLPIMEKFMNCNIDISRRQRRWLDDQRGVWIGKLALICDIIQ